jgi:uncharacterized membrane protein SirB2
MIAWNSPVSVGFDILFGVLPALYLGVASIVFCYFTIQNIAHPENQWLLLVFTVCGIIAAYSMIHVSVARARTKNKNFFITCLALGIVTAGFTEYIAKTQLTVNSIYPLQYVLIAISIVAIKHIVMLTRA